MAVAAGDEVYLGGKRKRVDAVRLYRMEPILDEGLEVTTGRAWERAGAPDI